MIDSPNSLLLGFSLGNNLSCPPLALLSSCCPLGALANHVSSSCPPGVLLLSSGRAGEPCVLLLSSWWVLSTTAVSSSCPLRVLLANPVSSSCSPISVFSEISGQDSCGCATGFLFGLVRACPGLVRCTAGPALVQALSGSAWPRHLVLALSCPSLVSTALSGHVFVWLCMQQWCSNCLIIYPYPFAFAHIRNYCCQSMLFPSSWNL